MQPSLNASANTWGKTGNKTPVPSCKGFEEKKDVVPQTRKQRNANQRKGSSRNMHIHDPVKGSNQGKNVERNKKKDEEYQCEEQRKGR